MKNRSSILHRAYQLEEWISSKRVLLIYGPRRVGKTTLLKTFLANTSLKYKLESGDHIKTRHVLGSQDMDQLRDYVSGYDLLAIDEAQQIPNIGMGLKILIDEIPGLHIIATGSSSFDLTQATGEPLTGRKRVICLYPVSQLELVSSYNKYELKEQLEDFLIFGTYPEVLTTPDKKEKMFILEELVNSYLLRDILQLERVRASHQLLQLLKLIAFQVGNEVSLNELATQVGLDVKTIGRYLDLLEKGFVIKRMGGFSRNLRNEITSKAKYYFWDNGIRNALIAQFNPLTDRNDIGALFENFMVMERLKYNDYQSIPCHSYFWRTHSGQEIDLIEDRGGKLYGYEFKWSLKPKRKVPAAWVKAYPEASYQIIDRTNYLDFILT